MAGQGLVSMTPTSISHTGTSASINADGGVDFQGVTILSVDGVFTSAYTNYVIYMHSGLSSGGPIYMPFVLRSGGVDETGSNYGIQSVVANNTGVTAGNGTVGYWDIVYTSGTTRDGIALYLFGVSQAQPSVFRSAVMSGVNGATWNDLTGSHTLSTAYDGFKISVSTSAIVGNLHVFGYEE